MTILHKNLPSSDLHEPKGIVGASTSDAGKVITPSASTAGTGELRKLTESEITNKICYITARFENIDANSDIFIPVPFSGTVTGVKSIIDGVLGTADTTLTVKINTTAMTNGTITITASGSAAGDMDSCTPTALNVFSATDYLRVTSNTAGTGSVSAVLTFTIERA